MIDNKTEQLMWQDIDGTITADGRRRLAAFFEAHPAERARYDELVALSQVLNGVADIDAPPELRDRIEAALPHRPAWARPKISIRRTFSEIFRLPWPARFVYTAAAGFALGLISYHIVNYTGISNRPLDISKIYGTMNTSGDAQRVGTLEIAAGGVTGTMTYHRNESLIVAEFELSSEDEVELQLEYAGNSTQFGGISEADSPESRVAVDDDKISLTNRGNGKFLCLMQLQDEGTMPIVVRVLAGHDVVFENTIDPNEIPDTRAR